MAVVTRITPEEFLQTYKMLRHQVVDSIVVNVDEALHSGVKLTIVCRTTGELERAHTMFGRYQPVATIQHWTGRHNPTTDEIIVWMSDMMYPELV